MCVHVVACIRSMKSPMQKAVVLCPASQQQLQEQQQQQSSGSTAAEATMDTTTGCPFSPPTPLAVAITADPTSDSIYSSLVITVSPDLAEPEDQGQARSPAATHVSSGPNIRVDDQIATRHDQDHIQSQQQEPVVSTGCEQSQTTLLETCTQPIVFTFDESSQYHQRQTSSDMFCELSWIQGIAPGKSLGSSYCRYRSVERKPLCC